MSPLRRAKRARTTELLWSMTAHGLAGDLEAWVLDVAELAKIAPLVLVIVLRHSADSFPDPRPSP